MAFPGRPDGLPRPSYTALLRQRVMRVSAFLLPLALTLPGTVGCSLGEKLAESQRNLAKSWDESPINPFAPPPTPLGPVETVVLRGDQLEPEKPAAEVKGAAELAGAEDLYRRGDYAGAEKLFRRIANNTQNSPQIAEEARFYEAECLRRQENYPKAADVYNQQLNDFHFGVHREQAMERMFELANYWLEDTREEIRQDKEQKEGRRWFVWHGPAVHVEKTKPLFDTEGRALEKLEQVALNDLNGHRADEALFLIGSVKFYRQDYKEADRYFSQVVDFHPNSRYAPQAMEYAIISKHMSTGGPDYDGRKTAEARKYVDLALRNYVLPPDKNGFLERQLAGINKQQAEKDFNTAEFYRRTHHDGAAYFYYEIVRRRYPGTPFYEQATARMQELKPKIEAAAAAPPKKPWLTLPDIEPGSILRSLPWSTPGNAPGPVMPASVSAR
jgi:outer membrane protein assembly factor BamD (BamD/ComL family)